MRVEYRVEVDVAFKSEEQAISFMNRKSWRGGATLRRMVIRRSEIVDRHGDDEGEDCEKSDR